MEEGVLTKWKRQTHEQYFFHYHYGMVKLQNYANLGGYFSAYFY